MAHINFAGMNINYIMDSIQVNTPQNFSTSPYIGTEGSTTNFVSREGRVITFQSICSAKEKSWHKNEHRINDYINLAKKYHKTPKVLTSPSKSDVDGKYICTKMDYKEDTGNNYLIDWEFKEVIKFNKTAKTFRVWGKSTSSSSKKKKTTTKKSNTPNSNVKYLLGTCGIMEKGSKSKKCVKSLQKFLQSKGYYKGYKVDGDYAVYTEKAVKGLQKSRKLKATGKWDKATRKYFQKKYKYPTEPKNKKATAIVSSNIRL